MRKVLRADTIKCLVRDTSKVRSQRKNSRAHQGHVLQVQKEMETREAVRRQQEQEHELRQAELVALRDELRSEERRKKEATTSRGFKIMRRVILWNDQFRQRQSVQDWRRRAEEAAKAGSRVLQDHERRVAAEEAWRAAEAQAWEAVRQREYEMQQTMRAGAIKRLLARRVPGAVAEN